MTIAPQIEYMRLKTHEVQIGRIKIGFKNPIAIQSMTNTETANVSATAKQCMELAAAGAEIVRITVDTEAAAASLPKIRQILNQKGYKNLALVGDFHFNGHALLAKYPNCAKALDKYRINPGNVRDFEKIVKIAVKNAKPIRIGANEGSIKGNMVKTVLEFAKKAEKFGLKRNQIVLSVKASDAMKTVEAYESLVKKMLAQKRTYALHLGVTEAGSGLEGAIYSASALSILLNKGIGDTIRISLTPESEKDRTKEVEACKILLQSLNLRKFGPRIISCPGCGRTNNKLLQKTVKEVNEYIKKHPKFPYKTIAIMGCIVNGPGEAKNADFAIVLPGKTEKKIAQIFINGRFVSKNYYDFIRQNN